MKTFTTILAVALCAALPALAAHSACGNDPATAGLKARMVNLGEKMDRIQWTTDRAEQHRLMDLHAKLMREAMEQIRKRPTTAACRLEMTHAMMSQIILHQLAEQEEEAH